jgi:hypothetical protein
VEDHAADQLDVEVAHGHRAPPGLAHEREALEQQVVELLPALRSLAQHVGGLSQLSVGVSLKLGLEGVDASYALFVGLELLGLAHAQRAVEKGHGLSVAVAIGSQSV